MLSNWNGHQIIYVGAQFDYVSPINIYKILSYCNPSMIMLSIPPDQRINQSSEDLMNLTLKKQIDIKLNQKRNSEYNFDSIDWLKQITIRKGQNFIADDRVQKHIRHSLKFDGKILQVSAEKQQAPTRGRRKANSNNIINQSPLTSYTNQRKSSIDYGRLNIQTLITIGIWQINRQQQNDVQIPIILSQLPKTLNKYNLINTLSLTQFQEMARTCSFLIGKNPDYFPRNPMGGAYHAYSDIFLGINDQYQGAILRAICSQSDLQATDGQKQKILIFTGYGQSSSIPFYLHQNTRDLQDCLQVKRTFQTIASKDSIVHQVQKLACFDAMIQWKSRMNDQDFKEQQRKIACSSSQIILDSLVAKYDQDSEALWASIYGQMKLKYTKIINENFTQGQKELKNFMELLAFQNQNKSSI